MELPEAHAAALDHTGGLVAAVTAGQWDGASPCSDWTLRQLVTHLVSGNLWVSPLVSGQSIESVGDRFDGDVLGDDPVAAYRASAEGAAAAFRAPGAMEARCALSYGDVPGEVYCGHRFIDVLIHGWDVAVAIGADTTLPGDLVAECAEVVAPQAELLAASGAFGTDVTVSDDADEQTRLLAAMGRHL